MLLGRRIEDPGGVEGAAEGLGLLPLDTVMHETKLTRPITVQLADLPAPWAALNGRRVTGYEIRNGRLALRADGAAGDGAQVCAVDNVLEVGTGCGYQTAVLAPLVAHLNTIERIEPLLVRARERLKELGIRNVRFRHGDGSLGWKAHAPFDGILVAAAPLTVPDALTKQLKLGGRLIVPVGPEGEQQLVRFTRREQRIEREVLGQVAFVPLLGGTT